MKLFYSSIIGLLLALCTAGCSAAPTDQEKIGVVSQKAISDVYTWSSSNPATSDTLYMYNAGLCVPTGFWGQTGQTYSSVGAWVYKDSNGYWDMGGAATPSGFAALNMQVTCAWDSEWHGANFDHVYIGAAPQTLISVWNATTITDLVPTDPGSTVGNTFYPLTAIGGDFSTIGSHIQTMDSSLGYIQMESLCTKNRNDNNLAESWGFQLRDANNNPITPHTVQVYIVSPNSTVTLPDVDVAFCFINSLTGPLNNSSTSVVINYNTPHQSITSSSPGPAVRVTCINFDLAN